MKDPYFSMFWHAVQAFNRQQSCSHLKGGRRAGRSLRKDYNVSIHRFPNGEFKIRCMSCGWEVWNKKTWSFKWAIGMKMVMQSTNTLTASEVTLPAARAQKLKEENIPVSVGELPSVIFRDTLAPYIITNSGEPAK